MATPFGHTADSFETQFGTNHLGHFVLVNRIARLIRAGGRLINLSSSGHRYPNVDLADPSFEHTPYDPFVAYGRSKTANILFAVAFDKRHQNQGVRAAAVHPGGIRTELDRHIDSSRLEKIVQEINQQLASQGKAPFQFKTLPQGAATSVWAAVVAPADEIGGRYCENCHVGQVVPDHVSTLPSAKAYVHTRLMQTTPRRCGRKVKNSLESRSSDSPISLCVVIGERAETGGSWNELKPDSSFIDFRPTQTRMISTEKHGAGGRASAHVHSLGSKANE
jgi:NAD(P)-dependent dehydrogenase (short-subunit alcohol dehydrogenase family)